MRKLQPLRKLRIKERIAHKMFNWGRGHTHWGKQRNTQQTLLLYLDSRPTYLATILPPILNQSSGLMNLPILVDTINNATVK